MIATLVIELSLAVYTIVRYKLDTTGRIILALLINLGIFQLAEYLVCTHSSVAIISSRVGYASITLLPLLGLHLMSRLTTTKLPKGSMPVLYLLAIMFVAYFLTAAGAFDGYRCTGNYVIFQIGMRQFYVYSLYYFGLILLSIVMGVLYLRKNKTKNNRQKKIVTWMIISYAVFLVPMSILAILNPETQAAVPSIMCGFAVITALIYALKIAPSQLNRRK
ncbi:hypothetical protein EBZ38_01005 [bacterium]|nr:hypothetical protein [bacterium]NDD82849.1 hypothetical protein [bacterium]